MNGGGWMIGILEGLGKSIGEGAQLGSSALDHGRYKNRMSGETRQGERYGEEHLA